MQYILNDNHNNEKSSLFLCTNDKVVGRALISISIPSLQVFKGYSCTELDYSDTHPASEQLCGEGP